MRKHSSIRKKNALGLAILFAAAVPCSQAAELNFSGFLSVGGGMVDKDYDTGSNYGGYEEDLTFDRSLLGLQVTGQVNEKVSATAQLIARKNDGYEVNAEWAYLTWQANDSIKLRAGRLRTPFYIYSDFLDVGYSYGWITPPQEVYYLPFNNVDGIDLYATQTLGIFDTSVQVYFGSFDDQFNFDGVTTDAKTRNQMGVAATLGKDWWNLRAAYHEADLSVDVTGAIVNPVNGLTIGGFINNPQIVPPAYSFLGPRILVEEDKATFAQIGFTIDTGRFVAAAEHVVFEPENSLLAKNIREYVMVGVRTGDWLFHLTAAQSKDEAVNLVEGIPVVPQTAPLIGALNAIAAAQADERDVISLGTRWDVASGVALKLQIDDVDDKVRGDQKVYSVAVQTVF